EQKNLPPGVEYAGRWWGVCGVRTTVEATIRCKPDALPLLADSGPVLTFWRAVGAMEDAGFARRVDGLPEGIVVWQIPQWHHRDDLWRLMHRCLGAFQLIGQGWMEDDWWTAEGFQRWLNPPQIESSDCP
ncbi:MAG: hypothetical protein L0177_09520, partial [Chloroflexi bacterium]|nr:hypothetical protein [Chloroflexota bacterium]